MSKLDRIQQLHRILAGHKQPVALRKIAERLECSERTAHRLIEDLQLYFHAPIEYSREKNGWYYATTAGKFELPGLWLTSAELQSLTLLLDVLANVGKGLLGEELGVVETQIHSLLKARDIEPNAFVRHIKVLPLGNRHLPGKVFQQVGEALLRRERLVIRYKSYAHQTTRRTISPQTLVYYRDNWYLDAWCHLRNDLRVFSLARIEDLEFTGQAVHDVSEDALRQHFGGSYGIFAGSSTHIARLRFLPELAREIAMQQWHPEQQGEWDGSDYILSFPYSNPAELVGDILRHVPNVAVDAPESLRKAVYQRLRGGIELFK